MKIDRSVKDLLGERVADMLGALKPRCPGLGTVTLTAVNMGPPSSPGPLGQAISLLTLRTTGWSPSLHLCDIDARFAHKGILVGNTAAEDQIVARVALAFARQRARVKALADLMTVEAIDHPNLHDMRDENGEPVLARLRPLPRRPVTMGTIDHLQIDSALVHACRQAGKDVHLKAALSLQTMLAESAHGGGWEIEHTDQNEANCYVRETSVDDPLRAPDGGPAMASEDPKLISAAIADPNGVTVPTSDRHVGFDVAVGQATVIGDRIVIPGRLPETIMHQLTGRPLGDLTRIHPAIDTRIIAEAIRFSQNDSDITVVRLTPDPWPLADIECIPHHQ